MLQMGIILSAMEQCASGDRVSGAAGVRQRQTMSDPLS